MKNIEKQKNPKKYKEKMEKQTSIVKKPFNIGQSKITAGFLAEICGFFAGYLFLVWWQFDGYGVC